MSERKHPTTLANTSRRQVIASVAMAFGGLVVSSKIGGQTQQEAMKETPRTSANQTRTSLHQEIDFKASPQRIYEVLLDSKHFAAFTGMPA